MSRSSLRDAAAIASTICQIAKGVLVSPNGVRTGASRSTAGPWPTQVVNRDRSKDVEDHVGRSGFEPDLPFDLDRTNPPIEDCAPAVSRPWPSKTVKAAPTSTLPSETRLRSASIDKVPVSDEQAAASSSKSVPSAETLPKPLVGPVATPNSPELNRLQRKPAPEPPLAQPVTASVEEAEKRMPSFEQSQTTSNTIPSAEQQPSPTSSSIDNGPIPNVEVDVPPIHKTPSLPPDFEEYDAVKESKHVPLRAAKVPSSRLGRLFHYGGLGAGLAFGAAGSLLRGASSGGADGAAPTSLFMSEQNVARLVDKLSTMRGAALKLGQFLSIQETKLLPPQIEQVLLRVQNSANYMPVWQMNKVMSQELGGSDWRERHFKEFEDIPFASASIGQVHSAVLRDDFPDAQMAGQKVAVKVQFPGVLESIDSDLSYLRWLVSASALLPKGLFLENTLRVLGRELKDECDYEREAEMGRRFRAILHDSSEFEVPKVVDSLCTGKVLTTEMMRGRPLSMASRYPQATRDRIAQSILNLSLSELFRFRLMQTDPNWSNFLYNERTGKIQLIDFGATREYSKEFMDNWLQMLQSAIAGDYDECLIWSRKVGYLTGEESAAMEQAHVESMIALGEPFRPDAPNPYPFEHQTITDRVKAQIPLMLRERLTPPPQETYSLNRKLSGAFLLCARLRAHVSCRTMFEQVEADYVLGPGLTDAPASATSLGLNAISAQVSSSFGSSEQRRQFHTAFEAAKAQEQGQKDRQARKHGRNLADRFPRSKIVVSNDDTPSTGSTEVGDKVESLSAGPASASMQETPADATASESETGINLARAATPAEVSPPATEASSVASLPEKQNSMGPTVIRGIVIPLKPPPPGPEECCMSGCAHCAYDIYAEDLEDFHSRLSSVRTQLTQMSPPVTRDEWREDLLGEYPSASSIEGSVDKHDMRERAEQEVDIVMMDLDPAIRGFLQLQRRMKKTV